MEDVAEHAERRRGLAGERVGGVRQVLHARHQGQRRLRGRVPAAGRAARAAADLRPLLRPRRADGCGTCSRFPGIIKRRSPSASRPPANFELVYDNDYYEAWRRAAGVQVVDHLPLQRRHSATAGPAAPRCAGWPRGRAGRAARRRLAAASCAARPTQRRRCVRGNGCGTPDAPGTVMPLSPGRDGGRPATPERSLPRLDHGAASAGRRASYVDGRKVGAADEINTPGQWEHVAGRQLRAGCIESSWSVRDRSLAPGDAWRGELGPVALERVGAGAAGHRSPRGAAPSSAAAAGTGSSWCADE